MGGVEVGGSCFRLQLHAHGVSPFLSPHPTLASIFSSIVSSSSGNDTNLHHHRGGGRRGLDGCDRTLVPCNTARRSDQQRRWRSPFFGTSSPNLLPRVRSSSYDFSRVEKRSVKQHHHQLPVLRRASRASLLDDDNFFFFVEGNEDEDREEEFVRRRLDQALNHSQVFPHSTRNINSIRGGADATSGTNEPPWSAIEPEQPNWPDRDGMVSACMEMKANRVDLPLSLRIIKRKKRRQRSEKQGPIDIQALAGDSACCSIKRAFSSMVLIVRELQSYTLEMREKLCYENLQGILARAQGEMSASFVWLFQQIFSCTPTLMVCVMLLLANFTLYSIGHDPTAMAAVPVPPPRVPATQGAVVEILQDFQQTLLQQQNNRRFDPCSLKSFPIGRAATSVGGSGDGGGSVKPVAGDTDDGGRSDGASVHLMSHTIISNGISPVNRGGGGGGGGDGSSSSSSEEEEAVAEVTEEEETAAWNRIKEEATRMRASSRDEAQMEAETLQVRLVSPGLRVELGITPGDYPEYWRTEIQYHQALSQDPENAMVLCNFAQFLHLVLHDLDRAECCFKRAAQVKPADAEALSRYANFLWLARNDLGAAEDKYLEAIAAADPSNSYYAASYAHFLWNTGAEDTCYPLDDGGDACN